MGCMSNPRHPNDGIELPSVAPRFPTRVAGWQLTLVGDYAEPLPGPGYVEVQPNGDFEVAFETDKSARDMGLPSFLLTRVPVDVLRVLIDAHDAKQGPTPKATRLEQLDDLTTSVEHISAALARVIPTDALAFAEIAHALEEMARAARRLAHGGGQ
jgi:hypothetical protein